MERENDTFAKVGAPIRRVSLHGRVVEALRSGIVTGRWRGDLPSEAELCRELQVGRMTLRASLRQLADERWITLGGRGRRHQLCAPPISTPAPVGAIVRILTAYSPFTMGSMHLLIVEHLRETLGRAGHPVELEVHPALFNDNAAASLARLDQLPDTAGWVLFSPNEAIQRWFSERRRPCIVVGRLNEGIELPCIFPDTAASARHAVGLLHARGHREQAYFIRDFTTLGDRRGAAAFVETGKRAGVHVRVVTHSAAPADLRRMLTQTLLAQPRPTGFFTNCAEDALTLLGHLQSAGLSVPRDAAVVAGWADLAFQHVVPTIACYRIDGEKMGRKAARLLLDLLRGDPVRLRNVSLVPEYTPGESLG